MANLTPEALEARRKYHREYRKRYLEEHPEAREHQKETQRKWREANKEHIAEYNRQWRKENPDRIREHQKKWLSERPEKKHEYMSRYWERKAAESAAEKGVYGLTDTKHTDRIENGARVNDEGWIICPHCEGKTKTKITPKTVLIEFPLYCPRCKTETVISINNTTE